MSADAATATTLPAAGLERRFYAFAIDRLLVWSGYAGVGYLAWRFLIDRDRLWAGVGAVLGGVLLVGLLLAVVLGLWGSSPGKAAVGLRVVRHEDGRPIGVGAALLRALVRGLAGVPTFGLGVAALAWTAVTDPGGRRRGAHDRLCGSVVVDVRPAPVVEEVVEEGPRQVVNLTAMRLLPGPAPVPDPGSAPGPRPPGPAVPPISPPTSPPTGPPATGTWRVSFDTGESFVVEGLALVGRSPEPRADEPVRHLVPLRSSDRSLSKTHAQFQVVPDGALVVMDRGSGNGSVVIRRGVSRDLTPGRPTTLLDGDTVRFGDRTMRVSRA